ncbi:MAG: ATP-binding protein [Lachnospiraceae bacterium]|nr:ATP-binding protein [Lachnospiraceae bacterium]
MMLSLLKNKTDNNSSNILLNKTVTRLYFTFLISALTMNICSLIDGLCTSVFVGVNGVAAVGIIAPVQPLTWMIINTMGKGGLVVAGQKLGKGDTGSAKEIFNFIFFTEIIIGILYGAVLFIFARPMSIMMGAEGDIISLAFSYLRGLAFGYPFLITYGILMHFSSFDGGEKNRLAAVISMTVTDIACNFIFAKILGLGMFGLGLATSVGYIAGFICMFPPYLIKEHIVYLDPKSADPGYLGEILKKGIAEGYFEICNFLYPVIVNNILMHYGGSVLVSIMAVTNFVKGTLDSICWAEGDTCVSLGSFFFGEEDSKALIRLSKNALFKAVTVDIILSGLVIAFIRPITEAMSGGSAEVSSYAGYAIICYLISLLLLLVSDNFAKLYLAQGKSLVVSIYNMLCYFILPLIMAIIFIPNLKADLIWLYLPAAQLAVLLILYLSVAFKSRKMIPSYEDFVTLGSPFEINENDRLALSVHTKEESVNVSSRVVSFINEHRLSQKTAYYSGLAVEEMTMNILKHGYNNKKGKAPGIAVRVIYNDGGVTIKIRDNGRDFNPEKYASQFTNEDPTKNIGIKLTAAISDEMTYKNVFHLNMLSIKLS